MTRRAALVVVLGLLSVSALGGCGADRDGGPAATGPMGVTGSWQQVFGDEFDGDALDEDRWQPSRYGGGDGDAPFNPDLESAWFGPDSVSVADGALALTIAVHRRTVDGRSYPYRSGVVQTAPGWTLRSGSFMEARMYVPTCDGCWPAFWAVASETWPPELDAVEFFDTAQDSQPVFNYIDPDREQSGPTTYGDPATDHREGWHVFGMSWEGDRVVPWVDGVAYPEVTVTGVPDVPMTVILDLAVRDGGTPPAGARLLVDWVRIWQPAG